MVSIFCGHLNKKWLHMDWTLMSIDTPPCSHPPAHRLAHIPQCPRASGCASSPRCSWMGCWPSQRGHSGSGQCGCRWMPESHNGAHEHIWRRSDAAQGTPQQTPCSSKRTAHNVMAREAQAAGQIRPASQGTSCAVAWSGWWSMPWAEQEPHRRSPRLWSC